MFKVQKTLLNCIILDLIGMATYMLPFIGEWFDLLWAPAAALIYWGMFRNSIGAFATLIEEILPFSDFIPTFTISYLIEEWRNTKKSNTIIEIIEEITDQKKLK